MRPVVALIALAAALSAQTAAAQPVPCGEPYVIQRGDTLQRVARRAYGPDATYHQLWRANRDATGLSDPSLIEVGQVIVVPCFDEAAAAGTEAAEAALRPEATDAGVGESDAAQGSVTDTATATPPVATPPGATPTVATPTVATPPVATPLTTPETMSSASIVAPPTAQSSAPATAPPNGAQSGAQSDGLSAPAPAAAPAAVAGAVADPRAATPDEPPADPRLVARRVGAPGLADAVVAAALTQTLGSQGWRIVGGEAPPDGALLFPVTRPDCARPALLTADARALCDALAWSAPLVEDVVTARSRREAGPLADIAGLRVCHVEDAPAPDLSEARHVLSLPDAAACLRATAAGEVDVALTLAGAGDAAMAATGLGSALTEQTSLARLVQLRAAAPADDPSARAALAALELGLGQLRRDGAWFAVVEAALTP